MSNLEIILFAITIIIILYFILRNSTSEKKNNHFLTTQCKKGQCYDKLEKCFSSKGFVYIDGSNDKKIERKTLKCILNTEDKYKLLKLDNIFVPSIMNGTFCDVLYTTYYDYNDFSVLRNRFYHLNMPLTKCIRIRHYHFQPGIYFEVKYNGGTKIRALIDKEYNLLEKDKIEDEYKDTIISLLDKIKQKKVKPIFSNTYKRLSFIYKNKPEMRITIDSNIEFFHNNIYKRMENDILEFKMPYSVSMEMANEYLKEINNIANTNLQYTPFSKFEYYYYKVIIGNKY